MELAILQQQVSRVPIELDPREKVNCIGRDLLSACRNVMNKIPALYPLSRENGLDVVKARLDNAELFKRRMQKLMDSELSLELVDKLKDLLEEIPSLSADLDVKTLVEDVKPDALELVSEVMTRLDAVQKSKWQFWSLVMNIHPRESVDTHVSKFMSVLLNHVADALMMPHRKLILVRLPRVCSLFEVPRRPPSRLPREAQKLAVACRQNTIFRMVENLRGPMLGTLDTFAVRRDKAGLMTAMTELFARHFPRKAGGLPTIEFSEDDDYSV